MRGRPERGFSLMEMMVVVAILLILSGIAIPSLLRSIRRYQVESAVRNVANIIMQTRYEAIRRNQRVSTVYAAPTGSLGPRYGIDTNGNNTLDAGEPFIMGNRNMTLTGLAGSFGRSDYTSLSAPPGLRIAFSPEGTAVDAAGAMVANVQSIFFVRGNGATFMEQFSDPNRFAGAITVTPAGRVRVWRLEAPGGWSTF